MVTEHLAKVPLGSLGERRTGDIKTVLNENIEKMELCLAHNIPEFVSYATGPVIIFIYLMTINVNLALISLIPLIIAAIIMCVLWIYVKDNGQSKFLSFGFQFRNHRIHKRNEAYKGV